MLPMADEGLDELGVDAAERKKLLGLIHDRLQSGMSGAAWQRRTLKRLDTGTRPEALAELVEAYLEQCASGKPVSEWD